MSTLSGAAALVSLTGNPSEYDQLREVLRRKLVKVSPALYPHISLDQILILIANGNDNLFPY
jgi:hypothetical protein